MVLSIRTTWISTVKCLIIAWIILFSTLDQVHGEGIAEKDDPSKTKCREHIEEALNKYWDQESASPQPSTVSSPPTTTPQPESAKVANLKSDVTKLVKAIEPDSKLVPTNISCEDDDNDGICNEDEEDLVVVTLAPCLDDDNDGICNEDEVSESEVKDEGKKLPTDKSKKTQINSKSQPIPIKKISSKDKTRKASSKCKQGSCPEEDNKVTNDENDIEEQEEENIAEEAVVKSKSTKISQQDKEKPSKGQKNVRKAIDQSEKIKDADEGENEDGEDGEESEDTDREEIKSKKKLPSSEQSKKKNTQGGESKKYVTKVNKEDGDGVKNKNKKNQPNAKASSETKSEICDQQIAEKLNDDEKQQANETELSGKSHVEEILRIKEIGTKEDKGENNLIMSIFKDLKKIYETSIKPLEQLYKYRGISTRLISDAEIFSKPLILLLGPKGSGKTSIVNYLLGLQNTPWQLNTGLSTSYPHFTLIVHGDTFTKLSPTELTADFTFSGLQQYGQHFLEHHLQAFKMPLDILQKMTFVDCPGFVDGGSSGIISKEPGKGIDSEVYQWFIDRSDVIYLVIDVNQLHLTVNLQSLFEQLRGREVRFLISKADTVSHSQIVTMIGQLLWMLSPMMAGDQPPRVYAITTQMESYDPFLDEQEQEWLTDLSRQVSGVARVESHIAEVRRHAVRVRNHAKLIDCYLATFYRHKGLFTFGTSSRKLASEITENPQQYRVFSGAMSAGQTQNISRYDLPDPDIYKEFFRTTSLIDFKPLSATCSFFKGCPLDKLDVAIAYQLPDLISKYKKLTKYKQK